MEQERSKFMTALIVFLYSLLAGISLSLFSSITQIHKYIFSLLALYIGIRFFKNFERLGLRITFFVLAIFFCLIGIFINAIIVAIKENPDLFTNMS